MKTRIQLLIFLTGPLAALLLTQCKKKPFYDYRTPYIGDYNVVHHESCFGYDTTYYYTRTIYLDEATGTGLTFSAGGSSQMDVTGKGVLQRTCHSGGSTYIDDLGEITNTGYHYDYVGSFSNCNDWMSCYPIIEITATKI
ncbi:MAG: hypothetical protein ACI837_002693 [Crocinitomicaceae bacterium]|jgi:hypothetical protein